MKISISGYDRDNSLHELNTTISDNKVSISFLNIDIIYQIELKTFMDIITNYNVNVPLNGPLPSDRALFKELDLTSKSVIDRELARILAISMLFMDIEDTCVDEGNPVTTQDIRRSKACLNDINIIEWSGQLGKQPGIYFIKKDYVHLYNDAIEKFYKLGLLYKYSIVNVNMEYINFLQPFIDIKRKISEIYAYRNIWNLILKDRDEEMKRFISSNNGGI